MIPVSPSSYHDGEWQVACRLDDGARLTRLRYHGVDLLTTALEDFRAPVKNYGRYETRPVYGYDDCFPTVDACDGWPDHGELCWLKWTGTATDCSVRSGRWPVTFTRRLEFAPRSLTWNFTVQNTGDRPLPFQHVMHPVMLLDEITAIDLPIAGQLLGLPRGRAEMFFVPASDFAVTWRSGLRLRVTFDHTLFPTLGIWWNNGGYPDEDGLRRVECAFEPTPGPNSSLGDGTTLTVGPAATFSWKVCWEIR